MAAAWPVVRKPTVTCQREELERLCAAWGHGSAVGIMPLATTGFSGASLHLVRLADQPGRFVLKPFAQHVAAEQASWVHQFMLHARRRGVSEVPSVLATHGGETMVEHDGRCWELVQFVEGQPCETPSAARGAAALDALGRLHAALESLASAVPHRGASPGVARRVRQARDLLDRPWRTDRTAAGDAGGLAAATRVACREAAALLSSPLGRHGLAAVAAAELRQERLQAVVRDIRCDHVLFHPTVPDAVAGFIDFHAAGIDTPLTDVARLLGSWRPLSTPAFAARLTATWTDPLAAYERARGAPLSAADRWLCDWLHAAAVICSLDNWFRWVLLENRRFADENLALARIRRLVDELPVAIEWLAHAGNRPV